jgi:hypothetical protein
MGHFYLSCYRFDSKNPATLAALLLPLIIAFSVLSTPVPYRINDAGFLDTSTGLARHPFLSGPIRIFRNKIFVVKKIICYNICKLMAA